MTENIPTTAEGLTQIPNTSFPLPVDKPYFRIEKNSRGFNWELKGLKGDLMTQEEIDAIIAQKDYIENKLGGLI